MKHRQRRILRHEKLESRNLFSGNGLLATSEPIRGISLPLWRETVDIGQLQQSLGNAKRLGVNSVAVNVFLFQDNLSSTVIESSTLDPKFQTASDDTVREVIDVIHSLDMTSMLKPVIKVRTGGWRAEIPGSLDWFESYTTWVQHYATIAEETGVAVLCVGTELAGTVHQEQLWRGTIVAARGDFTGQITYAARDGWDVSPTAKDIEWWDVTDLIGLDAYYPLADTANASPDELREAWSEHTTMISNWLADLDPEDQKKIMFTEIGYRSYDGASQCPGCQSGKGNHSVDLSEQADCYTAFFDTAWRAPWMEGIYIWNWEVDPDPTWEKANWYPIQGKPAEEVVGDHFRPHHNADNPLDVDGNGSVIPLDVLIIINSLNADGARSLRVPPQAIPPQYFYDVNGQNDITPLDALLVINWLNSTNSAEGESADWDIADESREPVYLPIGDYDSQVANTGTLVDAEGASYVAVVRRNEVSKPFEIDPTPVAKRPCFSAAVDSLFDALGDDAEALCIEPILEDLISDPCVENHLD